MHIIVERTGGFTGIPLSKTITDTQLSPSEASQLNALVAASHFFELPATVPADKQTDRFQYQITITRNGKQHCVNVSESQLPAPLKPLLVWLMARP